MVGSNAPRWYCWFSGIFLFAQGVSTLVARLVPTVDRAAPWLLATTHMQPIHSTLHIATALLAFTALLAGARATWWFAAGFGAFYLTLGLVGAATGRGLGLHLQTFDHPFHILFGGLGVAAALLGRSAQAQEDRT